MRLHVGLYNAIQSTQGKKAHIGKVLDLANNDQAIDMWERIMEEPLKPKRNRMKNAWPLVVTPHGMFRGRKNEDPISWSGLTYHDLDAVWPELTDQDGCSEAFATLQDLSFVAAVGHSMSGRGLSVLCVHQQIENEIEFLMAYNEAQEILMRSLPWWKEHWDPTASSFARAWFVPPMMKRCKHTPLPLPPATDDANTSPANLHKSSGNARKLNRTPGEWAARFNLQKRSTQWEGPCPLCGGNDRFYVDLREDGSSRVACRKRECRIHSKDGWIELNTLAWGDDMPSVPADLSAALG